ncbi:Nucleosome assembly protein 1-like 1 [Plecturocebus cupreus]
MWRPLLLCGFSGSYNPELPVVSHLGSFSYKFFYENAVSILLSSPALYLKVYEPMEEECEWKPDEEDDISEELKEKVKIEDVKKDEEKEDPRGIPEFWLTVFKNVDLLSVIWFRNMMNLF